jgi:hypothetical protein
MPKDASRFDLEITGLRIERLQDISEQDAIAEGIKGEKRWYMDYLCGVEHYFDEPIKSYLSLFKFVNAKKAKKKGFQENPWVWVVEFRNVTKTVSS